MQQSQRSYTQDDVPSFSSHKIKGRPLITSRFTKKSRTRPGTFLSLSREIGLQQMVMYLWSSDRNMLSRASPAREGHTALENCIPPFIPGLVPLVLDPAFKIVPKTPGVPLAI